MNRGKGQFDDDCFVFSKESATTITPADVNRDGRVDLVVPHRDGGQSYVYVNTSVGSRLRFSPIAFGPGDATIRASEAADLDRDGHIDIIAIDEKDGVFAFFGEGGENGRRPCRLALGDARPTPSRFTM